jgi:lysophospholipase L1-like esterase
VFTSQLQRILRERGVDVDVINGGVSGYSIAQHRLLMDEQGWALDPTLIVYCNLWSDNTWDTFKDEDLLEARRFAHLNPLVHSAAMRLLAEALSKPKSADGGRIIMWRGEQGWPEGKMRRVPLSRFIALHDGLIRDAASRGIGGAFLIPTNSFMLSGDLDTSTAPSWDPYFQAFYLLGSHHSQPVVDVGEVFGAGQAEGLEVEDLLLDLMHPSPEGHRRMAVALADSLLAAGWPESPLLGQSEPLDPLSIEDHPAPVWTDDDGAGSSQRYLFDISEAEQQAIKDRAAAMTAAGPPSPEAPPGPSGPEPGPGPARPDPPADPSAEAEHVVHSWGDDNEVHTELPVAPLPGRGGWGVQITVEGGQAPYRVVVRDGAGRALASGRMLRPASIRLRIPGTIDEASAELTDGSGQMTTAPLTLDSPRATLKLED